MERAKFNLEVALLRKMEAKMIELMGHEAYSEFAAQAAKEVFRESLEEIEDLDFKKFCLENFEKITGGENEDQT